MNERLLRQFYADKNLNNEVFEFLMLAGRELAADDAFEGEDTKGYKEVGRILEKAWDKLDQMFEVEKPPTKINTAK
jgi:hypothetical protein